MKYPIEYYKMIALPAEIKAQLGIRSKVRLDCIYKSASYYKELAIMAENHLPKGGKS